jgi:prepilin signal peptidase PulO-like enzyme (type II secretory pathway)
MPFWGLIAGAIALGYIGWRDWQARQVPALPLFGLGILGLMRLTGEGIAGDGPWWHLGSAVMLAGGFALVRQAFASGAPRLGWGDVWLAAVLGVWFGVAAFGALALAALACALMGAVRANSPASQQLPLASFMALAGLGMLVNEVLI